MPKNNKQECTEKIHKLIPEILKLEFGCEIIFNRTPENKPKAVILGKTKKGKIAYIVNKSLNSEQHGEAAINTVLGRPIQLFDVLRAIKSKKNISAKKWHEAIDHIITRAQYNLSLPYEGQSEEFYQFLNKIL